MEALKSSSNRRYAACDHVPRRKPDTFMAPETIRSFTTDSKVLPLFESRTFDYTRMRHYSLLTNDKLQCCWREFLRQLEGRQRIPFQFPSADDFHFYKYHTRYAPSQSHRNQSFKRRGFSTGSNVISYAPVPNDMHTRKTENVKKPHERPKRKIRTQGLKSKH